MFGSFHEPDESIVLLILVLRLGLSILEPLDVVKLLSGDGSSETQARVPPFTELVPRATSVADRATARFKALFAWDVQINIFPSWAN